MRRNEFAFGVAVFSACVLTCSAPVFAQKYPSKPIRIITVAAGGTSDLSLRAMLPKLTERLGQPFVIDVRPGASHQIATMAVKQSPPDGYTLLHGTSTIFVTNPVVLTKIDYDPDKDFRPITNLVRTSVLLTIPGSSTARSIAELVALSKSKPGGLTYAAGTGAAQDALLVNQLKSATGIALLSVQYKTIAPIIPDMLEGRVDISSLPPTLITQHLDSGRMRAIAVLDTQRLEMLPAIPTLPELGHPGALYENWFSLHAPGGTPEAIIRLLHQEVTAVLNDPVMKDFTRVRGIRTAASASPEEFAAAILAERTRAEKNAREAGIYKTGTE